MKCAFKISAVLTAFAIAVAIMVGGASAVSASEKEFDPERDLTGTDYYDYFYDYDPVTPFEGIGFTAEGKFFSSDYMEIWQKQIFDKDFTIRIDQQLRIEPIGNSPDT
ncbi:MAG: hypothetical protein K2J72_09155, partial [Oscillospiraceae bacterium]|nr:hypothetical protein [Oscillospiraceae bacterium]